MAPYMSSRGPFDGVWNIVRFNWPMFAIGSALVAAFLAMGGWWMVLGLLAVVGLLIPLVVSHWVYDRSDLYRLDWLDPKWRRVVSLHAGFDEVSKHIRERLPSAEVLAFDFYDPVKHTEPSIERARRYSPEHEAKSISTRSPLPVEARGVDAVLFFLSAHEIRDSDERAEFFCHVKDTLGPDGCVVVVEHVRDIPNLLAYSLGAFHFLTEAAWRDTFACAGLAVVSVERHTPLVRRYFLTLS